MRTFRTRQLSLIATAAVVCSLAVVVARAGAASIDPPPPPIWAYPDTPRTTSGGDPFASLPNPVECSPGLDSQPGAYDPLSSLPQRPATDPSLPGAPFTTMLTLKNEKHQKFHIYVSAGTEAAVADYIATTSACLEDFPLTKPAPSIADPVQFDAILLQAAESQTQRSQTELSAIRDELASNPDAEGPTTLRDVLWNVDANPDAVLAQAVQTANAQLQARVSAGELSAAEVATLDTQSVLTQLIDEPGADFLFPADEVAPTPGQIANQLLNDTSGNLVISMAPAGQLLNVNHSVIWFAFDPKINAKVKHDYIAQCRKSSSAQIESWAGQERLTLLQLNDPLDSQSGEAVAPRLSPNLALSSASLHSYDAYVKGIADDSQYSIYGEQIWQKGSGGGC